MPYLWSNIPSSIFYDSIFLEFLLVARCALRLTDLHIYIIIIIIVIIIIIIIGFVFVVIIIIIA